MRTLTGPPDMGPQWTDLGPLFAAADTALASIYWPWLVDTTGIPGTFAARYRLYYSTDHDGHGGGIAYSEADSVPGPWTHHAVIYTDTVLGTQTETPSVVWVPETGLWHMYYQQAEVEGGQRTMLATSGDGLTWARHGVALSIPLVAGANDVRWPGRQIHTGYLVPHRLPGGRWLGYHLLAGGDQPYYGMSWSEDGITWRIDPRPLMYSTHLCHALGARRLDGLGGYLMQREGSLWWAGIVSDWTSGGEARSAFIAQAPIAPDYRTLLAPPRPLYGPGNIRGHNIAADADGATWLIRLQDGALSLAVTA